MKSATRVAVVLFCSALLGTSARANFHLWHIREIYTNYNGAVQFVELYTDSADQEFLNFHTLKSNGETFEFTDSPAPTDGHHLLIGTPSYEALTNAPGSGLATPDYVFDSDNFFSVAGDKLTFAEGADVKMFAPALTDGVMSLNYTGPFTAAMNSGNSPRNYAGIASGSLNLPVPEPGTLSLVVTLYGSLTLYFYRRRSRRR